MQAILCTGSTTVTRRETGRSGPIHCDSLRPFRSVTDTWYRRSGHEGIHLPVYMCFHTCSTSGAGTRFVHRDVLTSLSQIL
ncbi:hypothetical protein DPMN_006147 [Dreissena polymorpha]|uniref:Uncharacterized protein n=1 Tax=Dreissena polymorpha TaxID=45954 RepID=A0A9D4MUP6_DREPO|nr:hypothetical protein DPMN_006147 [Dreissena polymorpha]